MFSFSNYVDGIRYTTVFLGEPLAVWLYNIRCTCILLLLNDCVDSYWTYYVKSYLLMNSDPYLPLFDCTIYSVDH